MIRSLLLLVVSFALVACGDQADEPLAGSASPGESAPSAVESNEELSPAQRLLLLLLGGGSDEDAVESATVFAGNYRASSPDPMPGRQRGDDEDTGLETAGHTGTARAR